MYVYREGGREGEGDGGKEGGREGERGRLLVMGAVSQDWYTDSWRERERERELITFPCLEGGMECGTADTESPRLADCRLDWNGDRQNTLNIILLKPTIAEITVTSRVWLLRRA